MLWKMEFYGNKVDVTEYTDGNNFVERWKDTYILKDGTEEKIFNLELQPSEQVTISSPYKTDQDECFFIKENKVYKINSNGNVYVYNLDNNFDSSILK